MSTHARTASRVRPFVATVALGYAAALGSFGSSALIVACGGTKSGSSDTTTASETTATDDTARTGTIVVAQVLPGDCRVFVDGEPWPEGRTLGAPKRVANGPHTVECRAPAGLIASRKLAVEPGKETPLYWGP